jgi:hypothetical protein
VAKSPPLFPKKITVAPIPASKRPKRVATMKTSLEAHRPTTSSDNVCFVFSFDSFFFSTSFSYCFLLQILMQKFLYLGDECVKIQETADASQGMLATLCEFFLSCICFFRLPLAIEHLLPLFHFVIAALTLAHARISALEAELKASQQAWESATAAKVSTERAIKAAEAKAKKAEKALNDAEQKQLQREQSIAERLDNISVAGGGKYFPYGFFARSCLCG